MNGDTIGIALSFCACILVIMLLAGGYLLWALLLCPFAVLSGAWFMGEPEDRDTIRGWGRALSWLIRR